MDVNDEILVLDKPEQMQAMALLQIYHKLKLEVKHPGGPKWRVSPMKQARMVLKEAGRPAGNRKNRVLQQYEALLREFGIIS